MDHSTPEEAPPDFDNEPLRCKAAMEMYPLVRHIPAARSDDDADRSARGEMDADSFPALRRLYIQMGFLLHDHGIETLAQLELLLKSTGVNRTSGEASHAANTTEQP